MSTSKQWATKGVADLDADELFLARKTVQESVDALNAELTWQNAALMRLSREIADRSGMALPGVPVAEALPQYPADQVNEQFGPKN